MQVGRNDLCPCGSGKKYKKCCLQKEQNLEMEQAKRERFFTRKHQLVENMMDKVFSSYSYEKTNKLKKEFQELVKVSIPEAFFPYWLLFYFQEDDGLRGIERYNLNEAKNEDLVLDGLAEKWENLAPRLLIHEENDEKGVTARDMVTDETFYLPFTEVMREWKQGTGTFCSLEEFDGDYYIHGVASFASENGVQRAYDLLAAKMKENNIPYEHAAMKYYPEILGALLAERSNSETLVKQEEVPNEDYQLIEEIGIPLEEAHRFYVRDILAYFREKAEGKSQSTYSKYRLGLQTIGYFLSQKIIYSWNDINRRDWEKWLSFNYLAFNMDATASQVKGFSSVLTSFITKVDEEYGTEHAVDIKELLKGLEPSILETVKALEEIASYQERRQSDVFSMDTLFDRLEADPIIEENQIQACFEVAEATEERIHLHLLGQEKEEYIVERPDYSLERGMVLVGTLVKEEDWKILLANRIFPPESRLYLRESYV